MLLGPVENTVGRSAVINRDIIFGFRCSKIDGAIVFIGSYIVAQIIIAVYTCSSRHTLGEKIHIVTVCGNIKLC